MKISELAKIIKEMNKKNVSFLRLIKFIASWEEEKQSKPANALSLF